MVQILVHCEQAEEFNSPAFKEKKPQFTLRGELEWRLKSCRTLTRPLCGSVRVDCVPEEEL